MANTVSRMQSILWWFYICTLKITTHKQTTQVPEGSDGNISLSPVQLSLFPLVIVYVTKYSLSYK